MPSLEHDELVELLTRAPGAALDALRSTGLVSLPPFDSLRVEPGDLRQLVPPARNVDVLVLLERGEPVFALLVEVQLSEDTDKPFVWPYYLAAVRARYRCPSCLLVVVLNDEMRAWALRPLVLGHPGARVVPVVVGPEAFARVTDPELARREPYLAILSAILHGGEQGAELVAYAAAQGADSLPEDERGMWLELISLSLNEIARKLLEAMMDVQKFKEKSVWAKEARDEGYKLGKDEGLKLGRDEGLKLGKDEGLKLGKDEGLKLGRDEGLRLGKDEGVREGELATLRRQIERRLGRPMKEEERRALAVRLERDGLDAVADKPVDLDALALEQWLSASGDRPEGG